MPVQGNVPEPLKTALEEMEATVQSTKLSLRFCAPEMIDQFWGQMQMDLADTLTTLWKDMGGTESLQ